MKVLNLQCAHQHSFEGWFGSEDDFQSQLARGLIECPMCSDKVIQKLPSAPRLNFGGHQLQETAATIADQQKQPTTSALALQERALAQPTPTASSQSAAASPAEQAAFLKALRHLVSNTEDVGKRFADEVRRMHYGDAEPRSVRGQTSTREALELLDEGIDVMPLPLPAILKETLQ